MKKLIYLLVMISSAKVAAAQKTAYWQQQVNYRISASLNDKENSLEGFETITYYNHSPDSLSYLWIHLWPNAFRNDKTAFSEQKLTQGDTRFYFSNNDDKGYINNLDFRINGIPLAIEDHPQYIDVEKILLPGPLAPGDSVILQTPFHLRIPKRFSRMGRERQDYSFTQWYPKLAVYDKKGWHEMPYLEWGEYYNDFGNYQVDISLPSNYVVAATGTLNDPAEIAWMKLHNTSGQPKKEPTKKKVLLGGKKEKPAEIVSSGKMKTLHYSAQNVTDFAWFADKTYIVKYDSIHLNTHIVDAWNFVLPADEIKWKNSISFTKNAIRFYSSQAGDYPFPQVSVVSDPQRIYEGMEYPMVTILNIATEPESELDVVIAHEIGHNWFQEILASNERDHAWMDEGMNTFFENKYKQIYYQQNRNDLNWLGRKIPVNENLFFLNKSISSHTDQQIDTTSETFTYDNYNSSVYIKTGLWMEMLEKEIGSNSMLSLVHAYFTKWKFRHPYPEDFKTIAEKSVGHTLAEHFNLLRTTGPMEKPAKRKIAITGLFNLSDNPPKDYVSVGPAFGFNNYDQFELGLSIHNYTIPAAKFQIAATPMFAAASKQLVGYARVSYNIFPKKKLQNIQLYAAAARFNTDNGTGLNNEKVYRSFSKIVPGVYFEWKKKQAISPILKWADLRTFVINELQLEQKNKPAPADTEYYTINAPSVTMVIPQISFGIKANRALYPWELTLQLQQVKQIVRTSITANYFLNYNEKNQGLSVRFFFGKIFYTRQKTDFLRSENSRYHFTMYAPNGEQDYTYSGVFAERNQSTDLFGRQVMMRDGGFKYRSDYSSIQPGLNPNSADFFDNWLSAVNFTVDIPRKLNPLSVLPLKIPLKIFADIGTSASPWKQNSELPKFLYSVGLQLPLFNVINIYYPLFESKAFKEPNNINDPFKSGGPNWWQKKLTFNIDLQPLKRSAEKLVLL